MSKTHRILWPTGRHSPGTLVGWSNDLETVVAGIIQNNASKNCGSLPTVTNRHLGCRSDWSSYFKVEYIWCVSTKAVFRFNIRKNRHFRRENNRRYSRPVSRPMESSPHTVSRNSVWTQAKAKLTQTHIAAVMSFTTFQVPLIWGTTHSCPWDDRLWVTYGNWDKARTPEVERVQESTYSCHLTQK